MENSAAVTLKTNKGSKKISFIAEHHRGFSLIPFDSGWEWLAVYLVHRTSVAFVKNVVYNAKLHVSEPEFVFLFKTQLNVRKVRVKVRVLVSQVESLLPTRLLREHPPVINVRTCTQTKFSWVIIMASVGLKPKGSVQRAFRAASSAWAAVLLPDSSFESLNQIKSLCGQSLLTP